MPSAFSRLGYGALIVETTENTPIKPTGFFGLTGFDVVTKFGAKPSSNIFATRDLFINAIKDAIPAPTGKMSLEMEPKMFGHFLKGVLGTPAKGIYLNMRLRLNAGTITGTPAVGATLAQATSLATATVTAVFDATHLDVRNITVGFDTTHLVTGTNIDGTTFTFTPAATLTVGPFVVGETITGATSAATGVVVAVSNENDYLLITVSSGTFTAAGENISGGTSSAKATILTNDPTVYGHEFKGSSTTIPTYTLEIGYQNEAIRLMGVRFPEFSSIKEKDNIMLADLAVFARSAFIYGRVTAAVASGATKTILLDQTQGLTTADTIKVFRPSTGQYLDFSAGSVKTSSITSIIADTSIVVGNLQTSLLAGDLIVLAPQTPSYTVKKEFSWIGGTVGKIASNPTIVASPETSGCGMETSDFKIMSETESVHAANATTVTGRFPTANFIKAFKVSGKFKAYYQDMTFVNYLRESSQAAIEIRHTADPIGSTGLSYGLIWRYSNAIASGFHPPMQEDNILSQEVPFDMYHNATDGYMVKALLINDLSAAY